MKTGPRRLVLQLKPQSGMIFSLGKKEVQPP